MTEQELRNQVVSTAKKYYGCKESNGTHKQIIDIYNARKPLARGYKVAYTDAWCATFVSAVAILCGLTDIIYTECSCSQMISLFKAAGRWKEDDSYKPQIGDIIMYDWQDSGKGDNAGAPDHVGYVAEVNGNSLKIIEGNISNAVGYRNMQVNGRYIRGYCLPDYASKAGMATTTPKKTVNEIAVEVIGGKWGTGDDRKKALTNAGYNYSEVQRVVNEIMNGTLGVKDVTEIAREVISGKWGIGEERKKRLTEAGYNYSAVQKKVNELLR